MVPIRAAYVLIAALAMLGSSPSGPASSAPDADTILSLARNAASTSSCPKRLDYVIVVTANVRGRTEHNHFRATYLADIDFLHVDAFSEEEQRTPYVPHGTNIAIGFAAKAGAGGQGGVASGLSRALTAKINDDPPPIELLGVPELKPSYTFGLRRRSLPPPLIDSNTPDPARLRVIGSTVTSLRQYDVTLLGTDRTAQGDAYHLQLTPLRKPGTFRLRELWIDAITYAIRKILSSGNFIEGPPTRSRWLTRYRDFDGCTIIDHEVALDTLDDGRDQKYESTTVLFDAVTDATAERTPVLDFRRPHEDDDLMEPGE